jgi:hypothetical protein
MNNTHGLLFYRSGKNGATWRLESYGDTDEMTLAELKTMRSSNGKFINEPWLLMLDDDVVNYFGLAEMYKTVMSPEQVERFFAFSVDKMEKTLKGNMPKGMKNLLLAVAREKVASGSLDSTAKRQLFETIFGVDLEPDVVE